MGAPRLPRWRIAWACAALPWSDAAAEPPPAAEAQALIEVLATELLEPGRDASGIGSGFAAVLDGAFDVEAMARRALGDGWETASADGRASYLGAYRCYLIDSFVGGFRTIPGATWQILGTRTMESGDIVVFTRFDEPEAGPRDIEWFVRPHPQPRVIDTAVDGVTLSVVHHEAFAELMGAEAGLDALVDALSVADCAGETP